MKAIIVFNNQRIDLEAVAYSVEGSALCVLSQDGKRYVTGAQNVLLIDTFVQPSV